MYHNKVCSVSHCYLVILCTFLPLCLLLIFQPLLGETPLICYDLAKLTLNSSEIIKYTCFCAPKALYSYENKIYYTHIMLHCMYLFLLLDWDKFENRRNTLTSSLVHGFVRLVHRMCFLNALQIKYIQFDYIYGYIPIHTHPG